MDLRQNIQLYIPVVPVAGDMCIDESTDYCHWSPTDEEFGLLHFQN